MSTYADWSASRQSASNQHTPTASSPVKVVMDSQGNVIRDAQLPVMSSQVDSGMMEEVRMSLDDQQAIVHNIRQQHRDSNSKAGMHEHATTLSEDQRAWNNKAIPPSTILLVIGMLGNSHVS